MSRGYPSDWDSRRQDIYRRDGYTCQNCGVQGDPYGNTELNAHHIVPKSKGGTHSKSNLVTICKPCHNAVHYDHQAPLPAQSNSKNNYLELAKDHNEELTELLMKFGETCIESADFVERVEGDLAILSDGTLENQELENKRVELIQRLGTIDLLLEPFEGNYKILDDIESYTNTLVSLFTTFEMVGEVIADDSLTDSEKRRIIEPKISKKLQQVNQESRHTKKSIDEFNQQVNEAQEPSSFLSRLSNI